MRHKESSGCCHGNENTTRERYNTTINKEFGRVGVIFSYSEPIHFGIVENSFSLSKDYHHQLQLIAKHSVLVTSSYPSSSWYPVRLQLHQLLPVDLDLEWAGRLHQLEVVVLHLAHLITLHHLTNSEIPACLLIRTGVVLLPPGRMDTGGTHTEDHRPLLEVEAMNGGPRGLPFTTNHLRRLLDIVVIGLLLRDRTTIDVLVAPLRLVVLGLHPTYDRHIDRVRTVAAEVESLLQSAM